MPTNNHKIQVSQSTQYQQPFTKEFSKDSNHKIVSNLRKIWHLTKIRKTCVHPNFHDNLFIYRRKQFNSSFLQKTYLSQPVKPPTNKPEPMSTRSSNSIPEIPSHISNNFKHSDPRNFFQKSFIKWMVKPSKIPENQDPEYNRSIITKILKQLARKHPHYNVRNQHRALYTNSEPTNQITYRHL